MNTDNTSKDIDTPKDTDTPKKPAGSNGRLKRFFAILGLIFIAVCIIGLIVSIAMGCEPGVTLMFLFGLIVVPVIFYAFSMTIKLIR